MHRFNELIILILPRGCGSPAEIDLPRVANMIRDDIFHSYARWVVVPWLSCEIL